MHPTGSPLAMSGARRAVTPRQSQSVIGGLTRDAFEVNESLVFGQNYRTDVGSR
jgi:hypothetical protein